MLSSGSLKKKLHIIERMINIVPNQEAETYQIFKYFEEESDSVATDGHGTLEPLWKFNHPLCKRKTVTALGWSSKYSDLFAVGFGSYDFHKQMSGTILCYTLKNTSHPEYTITTEAGVMSLDFHPQHSSLLAVGLYDGTVCVYDVSKSVTTPIFGT